MAKQEISMRMVKDLAGAGASRAGSHVLGLGGRDSHQIAQLVRKGFAFGRLAAFQKATELPWERVACFVGIPQRTLTRRQSEGRLAPDESDRVWRASALFDRAVELFEGDVAQARRWLQMPQEALGGEIPLEFAGTHVGAREVEDLLGRLEHGVFT